MNDTLYRFLPALALALFCAIPSTDAQSQVLVTSADPASAPQGTISLDVTVNGNGFDSTAAVNFLVTGTTNPGGITVKKVAVRGSKKLIATIEIAATAVVTNFDIEVQLSGGRKGKGTSLFAVLSKPNSDPCAVGASISRRLPSEISRQVEGDFCRGFNRKMRSLGTQVEHFPGHRRRVQLSSEWHDQPRPDYVVGEWAHLRQRGFHCEHGQQSNNCFRKENDPNGRWRLFQLSKGGDAWYSNRYPSAGRTIIERISIDSSVHPYRTLLLLS